MADQEPREMTPREEWLAESFARQASVLADLAARAGAASDPAAECSGWLAVRRQAQAYLRVFGNRAGSRAFRSLAHRVDSHRWVLDGFLEEAQSRLQTFDGDLRSEAGRGLGIRLAVIGKGGAGKSVVSGTLARILARRGRRVLAVDLDTNPGLAFSLGLPHTRGGLPPEALEQRPGAPYGWTLAAGLTPTEAVERCSVEAPDGVRFLGLGKIDDPDKSAPKRSLAALLQILRGFGEPGWDVVGDLEAGPTTPFERYHSFADHVLIVVGPAWRSALTARRLLPLVGDVPAIVVANRFREEPDHPGLPPAVRIPFDPDVAEAERLGLAPLDACPGSPAVKAVADLAEMFVAQEVPV